MLYVEQQTRNFVVGITVQRITTSGGNSLKAELFMGSGPKRGQYPAEHGGGGFPSVRRSDYPPIRRHARPLVHLGFLMKERIESYQLGKNGGGTYGCYHLRAASQNEKDDITCFTSQIVEELTKESLNGSISLKGNGDDKLPPMKEGE